MSTVAVVIALGAAIAFGWSTAAMHNSAFAAPGHLRTLPSLLRHVVGQPRWLSGMAASVTGLVLQAVSLSLGTLVLVQPIIATALLWALGFGELLARRRPSRAIVTWAAVMAAGLALFFVTDTSTRGHRTPAAAAAITLSLVGAAFAGACWVAGDRVSARRSGLLLGAAAGVMFGLVAGTLKATTAARGFVDLVSGWPLWFLLVLGAAAFSLNQAAYSKVPLAQSLPMVNVVNPIVALTYGVAAYAERPTGTPLELALEVVGLAVTLLAVFMLAREGDAVLDAGERRGEQTGILAA
jgi:drug/metabolite transporter (DMT)-like permease